jgi:hypothetical protein
MTINLHAKTDFAKGDVGHVSGHEVRKAVSGQASGPSLVRALQDVRAGAHGWFETSD